MLDIALRMKKIEGNRIVMVVPSLYQNLYLDISGVGSSDWMQPATETALHHRIISQNRTAFEADRMVTRAEGFAMVMASVCLYPSDTVRDTWQEKLWQVAYDQ